MGAEAGRGGSAGVELAEYAPQAPSGVSYTQPDQVLTLTWLQSPDITGLILSSAYPNCGPPIVHFRIRTFRTLLTRSARSLSLGWCCC